MTLKNVLIQLINYVTSPIIEIKAEEILSKKREKMDGGVSKGRNSKETHKHRERKGRRQERRRGAPRELGHSTGLKRTSLLGTA